MLQRLARSGEKSLDTETTGLYWSKGHRLFSLIICDEDGPLYFNFQNYPECEALPRPVLFALQEQVFSRPDIYWYLANAKFDMHMLQNEGCSLAGKIHCTMVFERLIWNKHFAYGLEATAPRYGFEKSKVVDKYITKHKLFTVRRQEGKKKEFKDKHFDRVPFPIISEYGLQDGVITRGIGTGQRQILNKFYGSFTAKPEIMSKAKALGDNERALTKVCFAMEREGIKIDRAYCEQAFATSKARADKAAREFEVLTHCTFADSGHDLAKILKAVGVQPGRTAPSVKFPEGQDSYNKAALVAAKHEVADLVLTYRKNAKVAGTYYRNFLDLADQDDLIHADFRQAGTDTARFSMSEPNLQNLKKNEDEEDAGDDEEALGAEETFQVRRCFVPPDDHCFVMIDYDQQEYRMALDYAGQLDLIEKVKAGLDVHTATAELMDVTRFRAKTLNFLLLYGGGARKLALTLGISLEAAKALIEHYFKSLRDVQRFIREVQNDATKVGYIMNWAGRVYRFDKDSAYKSPNTLIQGGGGDIMRFAMVQCAAFLEGRKSRQLVTVHDELLFKIHQSEMAIVPELVNIMENIYPSKHLKLTCSASHSWKSWADKVKGAPT